MRASTRPGPAGMAARDAALHLISAVLDRHRSLTDVLDEGLAGTTNPADRAFARLMAATVLRRLGEIDALLAQRLDRPLSRKARPVQHILRLGTAQIAFLGTATHAVVNCGVEQAKACPGRYDKLVNAILRKIAPVDADTGPEDPAINVPDWLWSSWRDAYGSETARHIARAHLREAPLDLSLRDPADTAQWATTLGGTSLAPGHVRLSRAGDVASLPGYETGDWWVQDFAASLPARVLVAGLENPSGAGVADLCAAPGGKTAQIAATGAVVTAVDSDPARVTRLEANLARLRLRATVCTADVAHWRPEDGRRFDAVLLDAPCTATGTIRRHPDIPWLKRPDDIAKAAVTQREMLRAALELVRPGGMLVYAVCSLQREEGKAQIDRVVGDGLARRTPIHENECAGIGVPDDEGDIQTLPHHRAGEGGMDGFFVARLHRPS